MKKLLKSKSLALKGLQGFVLLVVIFLTSMASAQGAAASPSQLKENVLKLALNENAPVKGPVEKGNVHACDTQGDGPSIIACREGEVSIQNAVWLFLVALVGFVFLINSKS